jgi:hypothetical protein
LLSFDFSHLLVSQDEHHITADEHGKLIITFRQIAPEITCAATVKNGGLKIEMREVNTNDANSLD